MSTCPNCTAQMLDDIECQECGFSELHSFWDMPDELLEDADSPVDDLPHHNCGQLENGVCLAADSEWCVQCPFNHTAIN